MKIKLNKDWGANNADYIALHRRIKKLLIKPEKCVCCRRMKPKDLANISGNYLEDVDDWEWLCRSCHMHKDGRINNLKKGLPKGKQHPFWGKRIPKEVRTKISESLKIYFKEKNKKGGDFK